MNKEIDFEGSDLFYKVLMSFRKKCFYISYENLTDLYFLEHYMKSLGYSFEDRKNIKEDSKGLLIVDNDKKTIKICKHKKDNVFTVDIKNLFTVLEQRRSNRYSSDGLKVFFDIRSKKDEKRLKKFLKEYYPSKGCIDGKLVLNSSRVLKSNLVIDVKRMRSGKCYNGKEIGLTKDGYGFVNLRLTDQFRYLELINFDEFKDSRLYKYLSIKKGFKHE